MVRPNILMPQLPQYIEPVYRPPSEARSLILQATIGCSWNRCSFCDMYSGKRFRPRPENELCDEIKQIASHATPFTKLFLADGDAMVLSTRRLLHLLKTIRDELPQIRRVSAYALPANLSQKSPTELNEIRDAGLSLIYVGIESGDDEILQRINKGETLESTVAGLNLAGDAGIKRSVMIISGLGGRAHSAAHAHNSARVLNQTQPEFASLLTLMLPNGPERFLKGWKEFEFLDALGVLKEAAQLIEATELKQTVFRSDHASNYLALKGTLGRDRARLLEQIRAVIESPQGALRPEEWRGL